MRCVFDANIIINAALFENSKPAHALIKAFYEGEVLVSKATEKELEEVFFRKKFDPYTTVEERTEFLNYFFLKTTRIEVNEPISVCRDPKDNMVLEVATSGQADVIITGDKDLLDLNPFEGIPILSPTGFIESF